MTMDCDRTWYALSRLPGVGPKTLWRLADAARGAPAGVCGLLGERGVGSREITSVLPLLDVADLEALTAELDSLESRRVRLLHPDSEAFPPGLRSHGAEFGVPPLLFGRGHLPLARARGVAVVGARNVDDDGLRLTGDLANALAMDGLNVVSGYAKGVDAAAHLGALQGGGTTTMVLAEGILHFNARSDLKPLLTSTNSLVLSQFHPSARWMGRNAMARNKLVCALGDALVVIASGPEQDERGRSSGTFDAARTALAMGLPVFVVSPRAFQSPPIGNAALLRLGCHELFMDDPASQITRVWSDPVVESGDPPAQQIAMF